jgi:hypothetical protein
MRNILHACNGATTPFGRSWTVAGVLFKVGVRLGSVSTILAFVFLQDGTILR